MQEGAVQRHERYHKAGGQHMPLVIYNIINFVTQSTLVAQAGIRRQL